ncbi:MAG: redoxin domain-containing protein [Planctomycetes bacterium]|nr:redoxin domain-containing protein [Planctomycetota bacterium]
MFSVVLPVPSWAQARRKGDFRRDVTLKVGDPAPDFNLKRLHDKGKVRLSSFRGKRPVVLIFGSYT